MLGLRGVWGWGLRMFWVFFELGGRSVPPRRQRRRTEPSPLHTNPSPPKPPNPKNAQRGGGHRGGRAGAGRQNPDRRRGGRRQGAHRCVCFLFFVFCFCLLFLSLFPPRGEGGRGASMRRCPPPTALQPLDPLPTSLHKPLQTPQTPQTQQAPPPWAASRRAPSASATPPGRWKTFWRAACTAPARWGSSPSPAACPTRRVGALVEFGRGIWEGLVGF